MSNYPDGMSMDAFDRATGGGIYEADWQYRDKVDAETVSDAVEGVQKLLKDARDGILKAKSSLATELAEEIYNLLREANSRCDDILTMCVYDARAEA